MSSSLNFIQAKKRITTIYRVFYQHMYILFHTDPPRIDWNSSYPTENEYDVDIVIEVYPLPTCYIEYEV